MKKKVSEMRRNHNGCCGALHKNRVAPRTFVYGSRVRLGYAKLVPYWSKGGSQYLLLVCLFGDPFA